MGGVLHIQCIPRSLEKRNGVGGRSWRKYSWFIQEDGTMIRWIESSLGDFKLPEILFMKDDEKL